VIVLKFLDRLIGLWSERPLLDYAATAVVVVPYVWVTSATHHGDLLREISADQRLAVYGSGAVIVSIVGGLSAIAITIYATAAGERARAVRRQRNEDLRRNWRSLFVGLGLAAGACLVAQLLDSHRDLSSSRVVFIAAMTFAIWRFVRLVWLFDAMIGIADRDLTDTPSPPAPELGSQWSERATG